MHPLFGRTLVRVVGAGAPSERADNLPRIESLVSGNDAPEVSNAMLDRLC